MSYTIADIVVRQFGKLTAHHDRFVPPAASLRTLRQAETTVRPEALEGQLKAINVYNN